MLPIGAVQRIVLVDERDVTITATRQVTDYGPLALVTLSDGACP